MFGLRFHCSALTIIINDVEGAHANSPWNNDRNVKGLQYQRHTLWVRLMNVILESFNSRAHFILVILELKNARGDYSSVEIFAS